MKALDVIVAGGGIAGSAAAAALAQAGMCVTLFESGLPNEKRLAGEFMHPPAVAALESLGLLDTVKAAGAVPSYGFALFEGPEDQGTMLPYSELEGLPPYGLAIDHAHLTRALLDAIGQRERISVHEGVRVRGFTRDADRLSVVVGGASEEGELLETPLLVSAQGRRSGLRQQAGIETAFGDAFYMAGWKVPAHTLPYPGFGHVFLGGPYTALAYQISPGEARVMIETAPGHAHGIEQQTLASLPPALARAVELAVATQSQSTAKVMRVCPGKVTAPGFVAVGDAGGCTHPLTAAGISFCLSDAVELADAMRRVGTPRVGTRLARALDHYERRRAARMRTRVALAEALPAALYASDADLAHIRHGMFEAWRKSPRARRRSLALLSTQDLRMGSLAQQYAQVSLYALRQLASEQYRNPARLLRTARGIASHNLGHLRQLGHQFRERSSFFA